MAKSETQQQTQVQQSKVQKSKPALRQPAHSSRLGDLSATTQTITTRFPLQMQRDYQQALFQAAVKGDLRILQELTVKVEETTELVDQHTCDNALWVAVAEHHELFALALLKHPGTRAKISNEGAQAAMEMSIDHRTNRVKINTHQKRLVQELLSFINADTPTEDSVEQASPKEAQPEHLPLVQEKKARRHQPSSLFSD